MKLAPLAARRRLGAGLLLWLALYVIIGALLAPHTEAQRLFAAAGWIVSSLAAGGRSLALAAVRRGERARVAWWCMAAGCLAWAAGIACWAVLELVLHRPLPVPSVADIAYLSPAPLFAIGILYLQPQRPPFALTLKRVADLGIGLCSCSVVLTLALYGPLLAALGDPARAWLAISFPVTRGAALLFGVIFFWQHAANARRRVALLIVLSLTALTVMAAVYASSLLRGPFRAGNWFDFGWSLAFAFILWASYEDEWLGAAPRDAQATRAPALDPLVPMLGIVAVVLACIVFRKHWRPELLPALGVAGVGLGVFCGLRAYASVKLEKTWLEERRRREEEMKRVEAQLLHAQKLHAIHSLSAAVAHEFRNLIMVMMGNLDLARHALSEGQRADDLLAHVEQALTQANDMTTRLVGLARRREPTLGVVKCTDALEQMAALLRRVFPRSIRVRGPEAPIDAKIRVDAARLEQALLNLAINARDAMRAQSGSLLLTARVAPAESRAEQGPVEYAVLSVEDSGAGIPKEMVARVFEPFFTTKPEGEGTGLGLAMVQSFAREHGGFVEVESEVGRGTRFDIYVPTLR